MKKIVLILVLSLLGAVAHSSETGVVDAKAGRVWACVMSFKGTSKGVQLIVGKFTTRAFGKLKCASVFGEEYSKRIRVDIASYKVGPTVGIGYFKIHGLSSEISLFNEHPEMILGNYATTHYEVAVGAGAGYFTAYKLGLPQFAYNVSVQLIGGIGAKVGMERMRISAVD